MFYSNNLFGPLVGLSTSIEYTQTVYYSLNYTDMSFFS